MTNGETQLMVLWPAVTLVGFLLLTALVIAMAMHSTARYERERAAVAPRAAHVVPEPAVAVAGA